MIIQLTTVHPYRDNRIFNKIIQSCLSSGLDTFYIAPQIKEFLHPSLGQYSLISPYQNGPLKRIDICVKAFRRIIRFPRNSTIVHFHDPEFIPFGLILWLIGFAVIYDIHEDNILSIDVKYRSLLVRSLCKAIFWLIELAAYKFLYTIIAERIYKKRFPSAIEVLNYPLPPPRSFSDRPITNIIETELALGDINLLYTGVVSQMRGLYNCLDLMLVIPNSTLTIVGRCDDATVKSIKSHVGSHMCRLNLIVSSHLVDFSIIQHIYMKRIWSYALALFPFSPHYFEKELTKLFEYSYYKIPVIFSDFPVWNGLISDIGIGFSVDSSDTNSVAMKLVDNATTDLYQAYRSSPFGLPDHYMWESQFSRLAKLYNSIV